LVGVFDIAYPVPDSGDASAVQPILFRQPSPVGVDGMPPSFDALHRLPDTAYFGRLPSESGHSLYAMSRRYYPLVSVASTDGEPLGPAPDCAGLDCLIGVHRLVSENQMTAHSGTAGLPLHDGHDMPPIQRQTPLAIDPKVEVGALPPAPSTPSLPEATGQLTLPDAGHSSGIPVFTIYSSVILFLTACGLLVKLWRAGRRRRPPQFLSSLADFVRAWFQPTPRESQALRPLLSAEPVEIDSEKQALAEKEMPAEPHFQTDKDLPPVPKLSMEGKEAESSSSEGEEELAKKKGRGRRKRGKRPNQRLAEAAAQFDEGSVKVGSLVVSDDVLGAYRPDYAAAC
jgi:hypothetical protein